MTILTKYRRGEISLTADEVKQYMDILKARQERRAKEGSLPADNLGPKAPRLIVRNMTLEQVAPAYGHFAGRAVIVADRAKKDPISITVAAATDAEIVPMIETQLRAQGIAVIPNAQGITLDLASVPAP